MQCNKCKAEWTPGSVRSQLSVCPFCGASLVSAPVSDDDLTMPDVMVRIVEQFGEEILSQERKCIAAFKDFAPKLEKEQKILKIALGERIADYFLRCPVAERESHMQKARQSMSTLLSDEASLQVVESFAMALGWNIRQKQEVTTTNITSEMTISQSQNTVMPVDSIHRFLHNGDYCCSKGDFQEAIQWYRMAAEEGSGLAMRSIGDIYYYGKGVIQNYDEAKKWYDKAKAIRW